MRNFFKFVFASCLGTFLAIVLFGFVGMGFLGGLASKMTENKTTKISANSVLELNFKQAIPEKTNNIEMQEFSLKDDDVLGLTDITAAIKHAKDDPNIKGIYLNASALTVGKATNTVLRQSLKDFKQSGKFIYAYAEVYTQNAYYLASVADSVLLHPYGVVEFKGLAGTYMYFKRMLDKLEVKPRVFYAGKFKSATEPFRLEKMSAENKIQVREYLNGMYDIMVRDIAEGRNISETELRAISNRFDGFDPDQALASKLVDRLTYEDEVLENIKTAVGLGKNDKLKTVKLQDYSQSIKDNTDFAIKDKIAVLYAEGELKDGPSKVPGTIFSEKYVNTLRKIRKDDDVKAIVLRINSPGGSVMASENIWREIMLCKDAGKPIVVSMGDLAASGGYYIAAPADSIFAEPNTITGSIGVFGFIPVLQKTFENKLGITMDTVLTGKYSAFGSTVYDFSDDEGKMIQTRIDKMYEDFLQKVATGRKLTRNQVHEIAQGRVWTGKRAQEIGLVDALGGLDRAIASAAKLAGLQKHRVAEYPATPSNIEQLLEKLKGDESDDNAQAWMVRKELGEYYPIYKTLKDFKTTSGIQARLPYSFIVE